MPPSQVQHNHRRLPKHPSHHSEQNRRQPGKFPKKLLRGNQYIMVLTESDSDVILVEPMKNCTSGEMIDAAAMSSKQNCFFYD